MAVDVVVPVYRNFALTMQCLRSVLEHGGPALGRLIVVNDASPEPEFERHLDGLRRDDSRVRVIVNKRNRGFVYSANLGLSLGSNDVVLLNSDARLTKGALQELAGCLASSSRLAAVSPLSNNGTLCSVPNFNDAAPVKMLEGVPLDLLGLPRLTPMPTLNGFCMAFRRAAIDALGMLDPKFSPGYHDENDWCQRARNGKWTVARANHALVLHHGGVSFADARRRLDVLHGRRLVARYPNYLNENRLFENSPDSRIAASAVRFSMNRLRLRMPVSTMDDLERARFLSHSMVAEAVTEKMQEACHWAQVPIAATLPPDITCVRGVGFWPRASALVTLIDHTVPLDSSKLRAQLEVSQAIVTNSAGLEARVRSEFDLAATRVSQATKDDHAAFLSVIRRVALEPDTEILASATRFAQLDPRQSDTSAAKTAA